MESEDREDREHKRWPRAIREMLLLGLECKSCRLNAVYADGYFGVSLYGVRFEFTSISLCIL